MLLEEGGGPAGVVVAAGFGLNGVRLDGINHHLEVFLQLNEALNQPRGVLEMHIVIDQAVRDEQGIA